jgi:hypothetical protein
MLGDRGRRLGEVGAAERTASTPMAAEVDEARNHPMPVEVHDCSRDPTGRGLRTDSGDPGVADSYPAAVEHTRCA